MDEETKYSSVGRGYEDVGDDDDDQHMDDHNDETFGGPVAMICGSASQNISSSTPLSGRTPRLESIKLAMLLYFVTCSVHVTTAWISTAWNIILSVMLGLRLVKWRFQHLTSLS